MEAGLNETNAIFFLERRRGYRDVDQVVASVGRLTLALCADVYLEIFLVKTGLI